MTLRQDNSIHIDLYDIEQFNNRSDIRTFLLNQWIQEDSETKYRYFIEMLEDGNRIYLERPGRLNKGCDFVIYIENHYQWNNGNDRPPDHNFILTDLHTKKQQLTDLEWNSLLTAFESIYNCEPFHSIQATIVRLPHLGGHSYELLLKTTRWFLIEQDITYWSGQGRNMFFNAIQEI